MFYVITSRFLLLAISFSFYLTLRVGHQIEQGPREETSD